MSSVVGFVLIIGISLLTITVVTLTGGPMLSRFQSEQQAGAMRGSFTQLDQAVSALVSGAPAGATPSWRVSMGQGSLSMESGGAHVWGYAADLNRSSNSYGFWYGDYSNGGSQMLIEERDGNGIDTSDARVNATRWDGSSDLETQTVVDDVNIGSSSVTLNLNWNVAGNTTQFEIYDKDVSTKHPVAEAWFVDAGAVHWVTGPGERRIELYYQNTAVIGKTPNGQVFHTSPLLTGPKDTGNGKKVFVRLVNLDGSFSFGGRTNAEVLVSGNGSHPRFSHNEVNRVSLYPSTRLSEAWERRLTDEVLGFTYSWKTDPTGQNADEGAAFLDTAHIPELSTSFVQTDAKLSLRGGT